MVSELLQVLSRPPPPGDLRGCQQPLARTRRGPSRGFLAERCRHAPRRRSPVLRRRPRNCLAHGKQRPAAAGTGRPRHPRRAAMKIDTETTSRTCGSRTRVRLPSPGTSTAPGQAAGKMKWSRRNTPGRSTGLRRSQDGPGGGIPHPGTDRSAARPFGRSSSVARCSRRTSPGSGHREDDPPFSCRRHQPFSSQPPNPDRLRCPRKRREFTTSSTIPTPPARSSGPSRPASSR